jgi:hypothetical protein
MRFGGTTITMLALLAATLTGVPAAFGHATYNLQGYGENLAGSTNGADGDPVLPAGEWTNGPAEGYTGSLPVNWYAGMHNDTQVRTIQTGVGANAPSGSLAQQLLAYNDANDPDLSLATPVLAVGGLSWLDPGNVVNGQAQGWGHGLDYGIIHFTPLDTILANGPARFTITLSDDPSDTAVTKLAFALYGGWDTGATSVRHQPFITQPAPGDDPLGSTGLKLIDSIAATSAGATLSRTYTLDDTYGGKYTVLIGGQDGVAGQYQLTVTTAPDAALTECRTNLTTARADADGDGRGDAIDTCASTPAGAEVDAAGCSQLQFCAGFDAKKKAGARLCKAADWKNDEPVMTRRNADCTVQKKTKLCVPKS